MPERSRPVALGAYPAAVPTVLMASNSIDWLPSQIGVAPRTAKLRRFGTRILTRVIPVPKFPIRKTPPQFVRLVPAGEKRASVYT